MNPQIRQVLESLEGQSELEEARKADVAPQDRMLAITRDTGLFYNILLRASGAKRVLEIGTSTGYSTLWFAEAILERGGEIVSIEQNPAKITRAKANFERAGVSGMITVIHGTASDVLNEMRQAGAVFDFVFMDADKENCKAYFDLAFPMLDAGGMMGTDNMNRPEKYHGMMRDFGRHIRMSPNARTVTLDIGNGQELTVKTPMAAKINS